MRVGTYIDGMNLYYGGRSLCGRDTAGWRWLDLGGLARRLIALRRDWMATDAVVSRIVYCTAIVDAQLDSRASARHQTYVEALMATGEVDVELGSFQVRTVRGIDPNSGESVSLVTPEEKGSDVNVASHMLIDLFTDRIDAAILISNDGDLKLPADRLRQHIPLGVVNPRGRSTARLLRGVADVGPGGHWWYRLSAEDLFACQLPSEVEGIRKPAGW